MFFLSFGCAQASSTAAPSNDTARRVRPLRDTFVVPRRPPESTVPLLAALTAALIAACWRLPLMSTSFVSFAWPKMAESARLACTALGEKGENPGPRDHGMFPSVTTVPSVCFSGDLNACGLDPSIGPASLLRHVDV
jgi:hypothetical protein